MNIVSIIPARGGSKGIPGKNIMDFCGKPLLVWSILHSLNTPAIKKTFVTSDSDEILKIAEKYGACPIKRPIDISGDDATSESAMIHALEDLKLTPNLMVMLQPTSPLRKPDDLSLAIKKFKEDNCDSLFSAAVLEDFLIWEKDKEGNLKSLNYDYLKRTRRQEREGQFVENGSFYIFKPEILKEGSRLGGKIGMYLMEFWQSFEIDSFEDLELVKSLFDIKKKNLIEGLCMGDTK